MSSFQCVLILNSKWRNYHRWLIWPSAEIGLCRLRMHCWFYFVPWLFCIFNCTIMILHWIGYRQALGGKTAFSTREVPVCPTTKLKHRSHLQVVQPGNIMKQFFTPTIFMGVEVDEIRRMLNSNKICFFIWRSALGVYQPSVIVSFYRRFAVDIIH